MVGIGAALSCLEVSDGFSACRWIRKDKRIFFKIKVYSVLYRSLHPPLSRILKVTFKYRESKYTHSKREFFGGVGIEVKAFCDQL